MSLMDAPPDDEEDEAATRAAAGEAAEPVLLPLLDAVMLDALLLLPLLSKMGDRLLASDACCDCGCCCPCCCCWKWCDINILLALGRAARCFGVLSECPFVFAATSLVTPARSPFGHRILTVWYFSKHCFFYSSTAHSIQLCLSVLLTSTVEQTERN